MSKIIVSVFFFIFSLVFLVPAWDSLYPYYSSYFWKKTNGKILSFSEKKYNCLSDKENSECYSIKIEYEYKTSSNKIIKSNQISFLSVDRKYKPDEYKFIKERYLKNSDVEVIYDENANAGRSVLTRDLNYNPGSYMALFFGVIFISLSFLYMRKGINSIKK